MINIRQIDHVVLRTDKMEEMLAFYEGVLGCRKERELPPAVGLVQLRAGTGLIDLVPVDSELGRLGGKPPVQDGRNLDHVCLLIDGIDERQLADYLAGHGIKVEDFAQRYGADGFGRSIYIEDPQGNVVELKLASA